MEGGGSVLKKSILYTVVTGRREGCGGREGTQELIEGERTVDIQCPSWRRVRDGGS